MHPNMVDIMRRAHCPRSTTLKMSAMMHAAMLRTRNALGAERKARAARAAQPAGKAHFAAVMGSAINANLTEGPDYNVADTLRDDWCLQQAIRDVQRHLGSSADGHVAMNRLLLGVQAHVRWTLEEARASLTDAVPEVFDSAAGSYGLSESAAGADVGSGVGSKEVGSEDLSSIKPPLKKWSSAPTVRG